MFLLVFLLATSASFSVYTHDDKAVLRYLAKAGMLQSYAGDQFSLDLALEDLALEERDPAAPLASLDLVTDRAFIDRHLYNQRTVLNYLDQFGYLDASLRRAGMQAREEADDMGSIIMMKMSNVEGALIIFQSMNGLPETGEADLETLELMRMPRCGVPDIHPNYFSMAGNPGTGYGFGQQDELLDYEKRSTRNRKGRHRNPGAEEQNGFLDYERRYVVSDNKWQKNKLAYYIENASSSLQHALTHSELERAFQVWTRHVTLQLYEVKEASIADIKIKFVTRNHGDKYPFDGPMGVLAHAFYPRSGQVHFDNDEEFTSATERGVNLYYTAAHEFGHSLGLKHSTNKNSLMSPYHPGLQETIELDEDDIRGITRLYPAGAGAVYNSAQPEAQEHEMKLLLDLQENGGDMAPDSENSSDCIDSIDAAIHHPDTQTLYFFTGDMYYKTERAHHRNNIVLADGYPRSISADWDGLEGGIDAAFTNASMAAAYFFKGDYYWKYDFDTSSMFHGFPKKIPPKIPTDLKAIMSSGSTTYFFARSGAYRHVRGADDLTVIKEKEPVVDAAFPLFVEGYFATTHGSTYSIYKVKNLESIKVYQGRPLAWDYELPMCRDSQNLEAINRKMRVLCEAYAILGGGSVNINIPRECYGMLERFDVMELTPINLS